MWGLWEKKINQKLIPKPHWWDKSWGAKAAIQAPPQQEIFQIGIFTPRLLKKWKEPAISWVNWSREGHSEESSSSCLYRTYWADMGQGEQGGSPFCGAVCYFLTSTPPLQFCNGHWKITTSLRSFDPRKKRKIKLFHQELGEGFSQELHFFTYSAHAKCKLIWTRFGITHILSDVKMYFANRKKGNFCSYFNLSDKCKWETGKYDIRESSKAELGIIAKTEGGYNQQRRLKPEVKAERIQKIRGFFL